MAKLRIENENWDGKRDASAVSAMGTQIYLDEVKLPNVRRITLNIEANEAVSAEIECYVEPGVPLELPADVTVIEVERD